MAKRTQLDAVVMMLTRSRDGVCGTDFLRSYVPRYAARIHELRREGWVIDRRPCDRHEHGSTQWIYEAVHP